MNGLRTAVAEPEWNNRADAAVRKSAEALSKELASGRDGEREFAVKRRMLPALAQGIALDDVEHPIEHFDRQQRVLTHLDLGFPCVEMPSGVPLPVALNVGDPDEKAETARSRLPREAEDLVRGGWRVRGYRSEKARGFLRHRLAPFLAARLATSKDTGVPSRTGFPFRVETPGRSQLRIHYSPAYFFDPTNVFGDVLSTPVDGILLPGRYVFGAMAPEAPLKWDLSAEYRVPGSPEVAQLF